MRFEVYIKRNMMVIMKASPHPIAANLILVLWIRILFEYSCDRVRSSEVIRSIIAVAPIHRLMSVSVRGIFISITTFFSHGPRIK
jgi:hypothetical protein